MLQLRLISLMVLLTLIWTSLVLASESSLPPCRMQPDHIQIVLPRSGFFWLEGEESSGRCGDVSGKKWIRRPSGPLDLLVYADGPSGSGRYWTITIGVADRKNAKPTRGVCMMTSTVGWRTLQHYKRTPLAWFDDLDKDGTAELMIWSSFPLREDTSLAEYGLVVWVYRLTPEDSLVIDLELSRKMAREIAEAYLLPIDSTQRYLEPIRSEAAAALNQFANERCIILQEHAR